MSDTRDSLPMAGVRIVAIEQYGAAPYGSLFLAQMGAEVIKVESPESGGDVSRSIGPFLLGNGDSEFFQTFNANKKSLTLNIKTAEGREVLERLVRSADALIHNLRGDHAAKHRLTYVDLAPVRPQIVCGHLSAYGRQGERASWPGYDYLMQAEAGFLSLTGEPGGPPSRFGLSVIDYITGLILVQAVTAGMLKARSTGIGCDIDISLYDAAVHQLSYLATWYLNEGHITKAAARSAHPSITPSQLVKTKDGWIFLMCQTQKFWQALITAIDVPEVAAEPCFATLAGRLEHRALLTRHLDEVFAKQTTQEWLVRLRGVVPVSPVHGLAEALENPYLEEMGMIASVPHPARPDFRMLANPIRVDGQRLPSGTAPKLGENTEEILGDLGYSHEQITAFRAGRVI
jgi:crotonobetainyl-CoA:carnitine CoA-transferase CaiB-like acyl-CoA transferase